jgi:2-keto-4-pentenoate hydratase/2-oxohepta-3-ene-1,7-dioic acid hydratase in catechol pathway
MRLYTFEADGRSRLGVEATKGTIADVNLLLKGLGNSEGDSSVGSMLELIQGGKPALDTVERVAARVNEEPELKGQAGEKAIFRIEEVRIRPPLPRPGKILAAARNDSTIPFHAEKFKKTGIPNFFIKTPNTLVGDGDRIVMIPEQYSQFTSTEVEIAVVIGKRVRMLRSERETEDAVFGYTAFNDVTAQDINGGTSGEDYLGRRLPTQDNPRIGIVLAKNYDTFGPIGPCLVTKDELPVNALNELDLRVYINGKLAQNGNARNYLWKPLQSVQYFSQFMTLEPGDVVAAGTVDLSGRAILHPGDKVVTEVSRIGEISNSCVAWEEVWGPAPGHWSGP